MPKHSNTLEKLLAAHALEIDQLLQSAIAERAGGNTPKRLRDAMNYAATNGGKRLRPFLVSQTAAMLGRQDQGVLMAGAALECIHSYSLVHDDLPAMDNDDLRRGKPTTHKAYDEATAILVGDALQTLGFELLSDEIIHADPAKRLILIRELAKASGAAGMVGGQLLDLAAEGRFDGARPVQSEPSIRAMQAMKTGALLRFACVAGAELADASPHDIETMRQFGEIIGLAFQLADDILDRTGSAASLGKSAGKDEAAGKATLVDFLGLEQAKVHLDKQVKAAHAILDGYGSDADILRQTASFIAHRLS